MPSLVGAITTLGLLGVSAAAPVYHSDYATAEFPRPYTQTFTQLGLGATPSIRHQSFIGKDTGESARPFTIQFTALGNSATPVKPHLDYSGKALQVLLDVAGTDTWGISWIEGNVDQQQITTTDTWRVSWTEAIQSVLQTLPGSDVWTINWSESVSLGITGVTLKTGTDTWSVSFTESSALGVVLDGTDTWTVGWSEAGVVDTTTEAIVGTDTWAIDWDEGSFLNIFVGEVPRNGFDTWSISWTEIGAVTIPGRPQRITFKASYPKIWIRKL